LGDVEDFWRRQARQRTYQIQLLVEGNVALTAAERAELVPFFRQVRQKLIEQVVLDRREISS
jgi:hypothetical protein